MRTSESAARLSFFVLGCDLQTFAAQHVDAAAERRGAAGAHLEIIRARLQPDALQIPREAGISAVQKHLRALIGFQLDLTHVGAASETRAVQRMIKRRVESRREERVPTPV